MARVEQVEVVVNDTGKILISQDIMGDNTTIYIEPDQVDLLIKHLQEAKKEAEQMGQEAEPTLKLS